MNEKELKFNIIILFFIILLSTSISATRLPTVGGDSDTWGTVLNDYLSKVAGSDATTLNQTMVNGTNIYDSSINTTHLIDGTITDTDISDTTNLTLGQKITFALGEMIDNIVDGWVRVTGGLNVVGDVNISNNIDVGGNVSASYFLGDGSQLTGISGGGGESLWTNVSGVATYYGNANITGNLSLGNGKIMFNDTSKSYYFYNGSVWGPISGEGNLSSDAYYRVYDTGWISRSDWTNVEMGSNTTKNVDSNVTHNFGAPLSNLTVKVLISTDGTDANSFETLYVAYSDVVSGTVSWGVTFYQVDMNNIKVQTGIHGLMQSIDAGGNALSINIQDWYYKVRVTQVVRLNTTPLFGGTPAGAVMAFNSATCPAGWILADGTSGTPDLRGLFIRGAGTSGVLKYANASLGYFNATFGTYQNDSFQGHRFGPLQGTAFVHYSPSGQSWTMGAGAYFERSTTTGDPVTDGSYGTPRTGAETRPASYVLTYCMKTTEDSTTSNTLFQESGGIISTANSSHQVDVKIRSYNTSWVACSDWTDQHLGTTLGGNVTHNLNAPLSDLLVRVFISTDGTDANSFETPNSDVDAGGTTTRLGFTVYQVDTNTVKVQTGSTGLGYVRDEDGIIYAIDTEAWYYKIKVWKLG